MYIQKNEMTVQRPGIMISCTKARSITEEEGEYFPGHTARNPTRWKVVTAGTHTITCTVSDGKDTANKSISVDVTN